MTYEYLCKACGHQWEAEQPISAEPLRDCPACGKAEAKRQISRGGGFILKGGGWYSDLYASSSAKPAASESSSDAASTKTEAKPEAKPEANKAKDSTNASTPSQKAAE